VLPPVLMATLPRLDTNACAWPQVIVTVEGSVCAHAMLGAEASASESARARMVYPFRSCLRGIGDGRRLPGTALGHLPPLAATSSNVLARPIWRTAARGCATALPQATAADLFWFQ
jgi:hypothetical protein